MQLYSQTTTTPTRKRDALQEFLEDKLQQASTYRFAPMGLLDALKIESESFHSQAPFVLHGMSLGLEELITSDPRFLGHTVKMVTTLNGVSGFYPSFVGPKLLQRTFETGSASAAITWLKKVLSTQVADGKFITALWNVPVASEVQLTPDVRLVPFDSLPHSSQKTAIESSQFQTGLIVTPSHGNRRHQRSSSPIRWLNSYVNRRRSQQRMGSFLFYTNRWQTSHCY